MRKLILAMQVSLDGFIEGPDKDVSWMQIDDKEGWADTFEMMSSVDLLLLGSGMWTDYRDHWKNALVDNAADKNELAYAKIAEKTKHIIFSGSLQEPGWENATINRGPIKEEIISIKKTAGKDIYLVGGAKMAASVIEAGLVDEYRITINPAIIGEGKSFFRDQHTKHLLQLISVKQLSSGIIVTRYRSK